MDCDSVSLNNDPFRVCLDICDRSEISKTRKSANLLKKKIAGNIVGKKDKGNKNNLSRKCAIGSMERERVEEEELEMQNIVFWPNWRNAAQTKHLARRTMIFTQKMIALSYFPNILNHS